MNFFFNAGGEGGATTDYHFLCTPHYLIFRISKHTMNKDLKLILEQVNWNWVFILLVLPSIISYTVLFNPNEKIPLDREKITENFTMVRVSNDVVFQPSFTNSIRDIFEVPFDLKWYYICFENRNTTIIYETGETETSVDVSLDFNNKTILTVPYGKTNCTKYKFEEDFTYRWGFKTSINIKTLLEKSKPKIIPINETDYLIQQGTYTLHPDVDSYAKPEPFGIVVKNILFLIAWWGLFLIIRDIWNTVKKKKKGEHN